MCIKRVGRKLRPFCLSYTTSVDLRLLPQIKLQISELNDAPHNSNRMSPFKLAALTEFVKKHGISQEFVVYNDGERWVIVDGHHRKQAVLANYPSNSIVDCRDATSLSEAERTELTLSLNNNRGEIDLGLVVNDLEFLLEAGRTMDDLTIVGFRPSELEALLKPAGEASEDELLEDYMAASRSEDDGDGPVTAFTLEIPLRTGEEVLGVKKALRKAGGKGNKDLGKGLRAVLGMDEDESEEF